MMGDSGGEDAGDELAGGSAGEAANSKPAESPCRTRESLGFSAAVRESECAKGDCAVRVSSSPRLSSRTRSQILATWGSTNWRRWARKKIRSFVRVCLIRCQMGRRYGLA